MECFDPGILWDDYGIRSDIMVGFNPYLAPCSGTKHLAVQSFTEEFPRANIHELLSPDLLHQVIKGTFKDHVVTWINKYLHIVHGETQANEVIDDIDWRYISSLIGARCKAKYSLSRISLVPSFPGLHWFPDGRDFQQWTGDDSKALMKVSYYMYSLRDCFQLSDSKVYLAAIVGHVLLEMVKCVAALLDFCYIVRRNAICVDTLEKAARALDRFHQYRDIFIQSGVCTDMISLPHQHSLKHYL